MKVQTDFNYVTTIGFWISIFSLFLNNSEIKKILLSYSFSIGTTGIIYQYYKKYDKKSYIQNFIDYVIPITISIYFCSQIENNDINYNLFIPLILFYMYVFLFKINLNNLYTNFLFYNSLCLLILIIFYKNI